MEIAFNVCSFILFTKDNVLVAMLRIAKIAHQTIAVQFAWKDISIHLGVFAVQQLVNAISMETVFLATQDWHSQMEIVTLAMLLIAITVYQMTFAKTVLIHLNSTMEYVLEGMGQTVVFRTVKAAQQTMFAQYAYLFTRFTLVFVFHVQWETAYYVKLKMYVLIVQKHNIGKFHFWDVKLTFNNLKCAYLKWVDVISWLDSKYFMQHSK